MTKYLLFFVVLIMAATACQKSELIEDPLLFEDSLLADEDLTIEDRKKKWSSEQRFAIRKGGNFFIQNNVWGQYEPGAGGQELWVNSKNNWGIRNDHYKGNGDVKSFPAIVTGQHYRKSANKTRGLPLEVSELGALSCVWKQKNNLKVANATMELWFNKEKNPPKESDVSIMIWTQNKGMRPLGAKKGSMTANGKKYNIYKGVNNTGAKVHSFVQANNSGQFNGNIRPFITHCIKKGWLPKNYFLISVQAGWEIIEGKPRNKNGKYTSYATTTRYELDKIKK